MVPQYRKTKLFFPRIVPITQQSVIILIFSFVFQINTIFIRCDTHRAKLQFTKIPINLVNVYIFLFLSLTLSLSSICRPHVKQHSTVFHEKISIRIYTRTRARDIGNKNTPSLVNGSKPTENHHAVYFGVLWIEAARQRQRHQ